MIWKAGISIIVTFITDDSIYFVLFGFYLCLNWIYANGVPYQNNSIMYLIKASLMCNGVSIVLGQYINSEATYKDQVVLINLLLHLCFFTFAVFLNFKELDYQEIMKKVVETLQKHKDNKISNTLLLRIKKMTLYTTIEAKTTTQLNLNDLDGSPLSPPQENYTTKRKKKKIKKQSN